MQACTVIRYPLRFVPSLLLHMCSSEHCLKEPPDFPLFTSPVIPEAFWRGFTLAPKTQMIASVLIFLLFSPLLSSSSSILMFTLVLAVQMVFPRYDHGFISADQPTFQRRMLKVAGVKGMPWLLTAPSCTFFHADVKTTCMFLYRTHVLKG